MNYLTNSYLLIMKYKIFYHVNFSQIRDVFFNIYPGCKNYEKPHEIGAMLKRSIRQLQTKIKLILAKTKT
jgi:hypothetical protein